MREIIRFILDIFTPQPLLVCGVEGLFPTPRDEKPKRSLAEIIGISSHKGPSVPKTPAPPAINIPAAPVAPTPPPPTTAQSLYQASQAANEAGAQQAAGFGYQGSLLSLPPTSPSSFSGTGPNGTINTATGTGSLLGLK